MALPTITSNSPVAGSIAYTAFSIQYNGVSYSVAAGNTANKYVWWLYNGGAPVLTSGNTLPDLGPDDLLLFLNKGGIGALVPTMDVVDGSLIVNGSILAAAISADQINASHIQANAVTSDEIAANAVTASEIMAGAVTTEKLSVGTVGNSLVLNGSFEDFDATGMPLGWKVYGATAGTISIVTGVASSGTNALQLSGTGTTSNLSLIQTPEKYIPVSATSGRKWYLSMRAGAGTATTKGAYLRANWYDANKVYISYNDAVSDAALATTWTVLEGQVTPPANAKYMAVTLYLASPNVATNMYVDEVAAREVVISAQIGDGAITSPKILANAVNATHIAAGTITAKLMAIGDFDNLATINELTNTTVTSYGQTKIANGYNSLVADGGSFFMFKESTGPVPFRTGTPTTALPREVLYYAFTAKATAATTAQFGVWIYNGTGGNATNVTPSFNIGTTDTECTGTIQVPLAPAGFGSVLQWVAGLQSVTNKGIQVKDVVIRRMSGGELIVDGSITAAELAADSVTATAIQANAITSTKIIANAIAANHISAGAVTANAILANAVTANAIAANAVYAGAIQANAIAANHVSAGAITADKLESNLVLTTKVVAGDPNSTHAEMSPQGFRVFAPPTTTGGAPTEVVRLGVAATDDYFAVTKADSSLAASISQAGVGSFSQLNSNEFFFKGQSMSDILWQSPKGHIGSAYRTTDSVYNSIAGQGIQPYLRFDTELQDGRLYKISTSSIRMGVTAGGDAEIHLRANAGVGAVATTSSNLITMAEVFKEGESRMLAELYTPTLDQTAIAAKGKRFCSFLISFLAVSGECGVRANVNRPVRLMVEDVGPLINTYPGTFLNGTNQTPPPPSQVTYVRQYGCTNSMNYQGNNTQYNYDLGHVYQGLSPAGYGNLKSMSFFNDMTPDLSGSTINYIRVYFNFNHWYYNSGGTARIGAHNQMGIPGTFSQIGIMTESGGWPKPGARWVDLPSNTFDGFKTGAYRGLTLEGDSTYTTYGYADRPIIEISFTK